MSDLDTFIALNNLNKEKLENALHQDILELLFKNMCLMLKEDLATYYAIKRAYFVTKDGEHKIIKQFIQQNFNIVLNDKDLLTLNNWIIAFFNKSLIRAKIPSSIKEQLLEKQHNCCAICHKPLANDVRIDHILPFSYVGDELDNNYQALCETCNLKKSNSLSNNSINYILYGEENK